MIALLVLATAMTDAQVARAIRTAPPPVRMLIERRQECGHWAGEEPYDADRRREIEAAVRRLRCDRLEADEHAIRRAYAQRPTTLQLLGRTAERGY